MNNIFGNHNTLNDIYFEYTPSVLEYNTLWLLKYVLKYKAFYVVSTLRFNEVC
jgi:hypothetical protein